MRLKRWLINGLKVIFLFLMILVIVLNSNLVYFITNVPSGSMLPTLQINTKYLVLKDGIAGAYERGDIVVFYKEDDPDTALVKRIVGLPGEIVDIRDGAIYVDGTPLEESYLGSNDILYSKTFYVPEDCYLFLGDNRVDSLDARYWEQPYVHKDYLVGKVILELYPDMHWMKNPFK